MLGAVALHRARAPTVLVCRIDKLLRGGDPVTFALQPLSARRRQFGLIADAAVVDTREYRSAGGLHHGKNRTQTVLSERVSDRAGAAAVCGCAHRLSRSTLVNVVVD